MKITLCLRALRLMPYCAATALLLAVSVNARRQDAARGQTTPIESHTQLIQITATVTDGNGKPVDGLRPENFKITEDGVALKLLSAAHYHAGNPEPDVKLEDALRIFHSYPDMDTENLQPLLLDRRLIVLFFDLTSLSPAELKRAVEASAQFVRERMTAADLVSVVSFGEELTANADFTTDQTMLEAALVSLVRIKDSMSRSIKVASCPSGSTHCEVFKSQFEGQLDPGDGKDSLFSLFQLAVQLRSLPGRKSIIHFRGIVPHTNDNYLWNFAADIAKLGVTAMYEVDMHATVVNKGESEAATTIARGQTPTEQPLFANLARESGGAIYSGVSNFGQIFQRVQHDSENYYLLSYNSANTMEDCNFPEVSVTLEGISDAYIKFRPILSARESSPPFTISLLAGYHHCAEQGIDSQVGLISKTGGLHISYDIIDKQFDYKSKCDWCEWTEGLVWRRDQIVNGHKAIFAMTETNTPTRAKKIIDGKIAFVYEDNIKRRLIAIFPDAHTSFSATIDSEDQVADMLLMLSTFQSDLRTR